MKFKDLEEGKEYICGCDIYEMVNDILWNKTKNEYSSFKQETIAIMDFKLHIEYCDIHEAFEHMKSGGICKFSDAPGFFEFDEHLRLKYQDSPTMATVTYSMLIEKIWVKL